MMVKSLSFCNSFRWIAFPFFVYCSHLLLSTSFGTRKPTLPLTLRHFVPCVRVVGLRLVSRCIVVTSYPRNRAASLLAWVMNVFVLESSSLSSSRRNVPRCCLISSASFFGPIKPSKKSSAYRTNLSLRKFWSLVSVDGRGCACFLNRSASALSPFLRAMPDALMSLLYSIFPFLLSPLVYCGFNTVSTHLSNPSRRIF